MSQNIQYKEELFDLINDLTSISPSIGFEHIDGKVVVRKSDDERTIPYKLEAPLEYFNIEDTIAFYNYPNFYRFLDMVKNPKLKLMSDTQLNVYGKGIKINYILSEEDGIINGPESIAFSDHDYEFTLSRDDLDEIVKTNNLVKAKIAIIKCSDDGVFVKMYTDETEHSFEKEFDGERMSDHDEDIIFEIKADRFNYLPPKRDYKVFIKKEGYVMFSLIHDDIDLRIFSGSIS